MTHSTKDVKVIDGYFPDWLIDDVGNYLLNDFPYFYNNTPYGEYDRQDSGEILLLETMSSHKRHLGIGFSLILMNVY